MIVTCKINPINHVKECFAASVLMFVLHNHPYSLFFCDFARDSALNPNQGEAREKNHLHFDAISEICHRFGRRDKSIRRQRRYLWKTPVLVRSTKFA